MRYMIGADVGGTFTDISLVDTKEQALYIHKVPSTPDDPSRAIMRGITEILARCHLSGSDVDYLAHGTTVPTNTLIERTGAKTGLITTSGFADLLQIGRQTRPSLYDLVQGKPPPLVPPALCTEVVERLYSSGQVRTAIEKESVVAAIQRLKEEGVESVAICFLFSYINPEHELIAEELVRELLPDVYVTVSSELVPEFREYPRLSTTVLNAYLGPVMKRYLGNFQKSVRHAGIRVSPYVTRSNGGLLSVDEAIRKPIQTAVSGPSAGVTAAAHLSALTGIRHMITFDMGGTSADISLIVDGQAQLTVEREINGMPARVPMVDIVTIGAGGGSIAWVDPGGALKVGPRSAGSTPGPACYGQGGTSPTVTDANALLGRINPEYLLGGRMSVDLSLAERAIREKVAEPSGLDTLEAAAGIIQVVNASMVRAIRVVSVERGLDPREFTLVAYGGAGPLHAAALAKELSIPEVLIPPSPGIMCSLGLLLTDIRSDYVRSRRLIPDEASVSTVLSLFEEMEREGHQLLDEEGVRTEHRRFERSIEARYRGQNSELTIALDDRTLTAESIREAVDRFHDEHERIHGYADRNETVEFVNYRVTAVGRLPKAPLPRATARTKGAPQPSATRSVYFEERRDYVSCPVYDRDDLLPGDHLQGPVIIEQMDSTVVVLPGQHVRVDEYLNLRIKGDSNE